MAENNDLPGKQLLNLNSSNVVLTERNQHRGIYCGHEAVVLHLGLRISYAPRNPIQEIKVTIRFLNPAPSPIWLYEPRHFESRDGDVFEETWSVEDNANVSRKIGFISKILSLHQHVTVSHNTKGTKKVTTADEWKVDGISLDGKAFEWQLHGKMCSRKQALPDHFQFGMLVFAPSKDMICANVVTEARWRNGEKAKGVALPIYFPRFNGELQNINKDCLKDVQEMYASTGRIQGLELA